MYNEDRPSYRGLLFKVLLVIAFVFLLMWLYPMPNMKPVYDRLFADNIDSMKDAAKGYFTVDRMPLAVGDKIKLTLGEMQSQKMVLPLVDSEGNTCDANTSYVEMAKMDDEYVLKVYLSCSTKTDYIIEHVGCYDVCPDKCKTPEEPTEPEKPEKQKHTYLEYQFSRTLYKGYILKTEETFEYEHVRYEEETTFEYLPCTGANITPIQGNPAKCLQTIVTPLPPVAPTKKITYTSRTIDQPSHRERYRSGYEYGGWVKYSSTTSIDKQLNTYPSTYDNDTKTRKQTGVKHYNSCPTTGDCASHIKYFYDLYKRTRDAKYSYRTVYDSCPSGSKLISNHKCEYKDEHIELICDTANGWNIDETTKMCKKTIRTTKEIDAEKKWKKIIREKERKWFDKTYVEGWKATGNRRSKGINTHKVYTGWVVTLPGGYTLSDKTTQYKWSKSKTISGWASTGKTRSKTVYY